jgi:exopolysaccharide production protein ExoQ
LSEPEPQPRRAVISWQEMRGRVSPDDASTPPVRGWRRIDVDGVFAFALFLPILFGPTMGPMGGAAFVGLTAAYAFLRGRSLLQTLAPRLFLLVPAVLAVTSALWSDLPQESFRQGLALTLTLFAALLISGAAKPGAVFNGITAAFLAYLITSRAMGTSMQGGMGDVGATAAVVAVGATVLAVRDRAWLWAAAGATAFAFELSAIAQARPAGALLGLGVSLLVILVMMTVRAAPIWLRASATALAVGGALAAGLFARFIASQMANLGDGVITGGAGLVERDDWVQVSTLIEGQRLLGRGFIGLWPGGGSAEVAPGQGLVGQNTYIDILLQLGWIGLWIVGATLIVGVIAFAVRYVRRPNLALTIWAGPLTYELVRIQIDVVGYAPFSPSAVLLTAALAATFSPDLAPRPQRRPTPKDLPAADVLSLDAFKARRAEKAGPASRHPDRPL